MFKPLGIERAHEGDEQTEVVTRYSVVLRVGSHSHVGDWRFAAEGSILPVKAKQAPRFPIEPVPWFVFEVEPPFRIGRLDNPFLGVGLCGKFLQPILAALW